MEYKDSPTSLFNKRYQIYYSIRRKDGSLNKRVKSVFLMKSGMEFELREVLEKQIKYLDNVKEYFDGEHNP